MPKRVAFKDSVEVDSVDLSNLARAVSPTSEHESVPAGSFNEFGFVETLAGTTTSSVSVEFYGSYGTGEVHATLYPIHRDREVVPFAWRPDMTAAVAATNPELRGNVRILTYSPEATFGEVETYTVEFVAADQDGLQYYDAAAV
jgi:hypothetical protein